MSGFPLNPPRAPVVDAQGNCTPEWYRYFAAVQRAIGGPSDPFEDSYLLGVPAGAINDVTDRLASLIASMGLEPPAVPYVAQDDPLPAPVDLSGIIARLDALEAAPMPIAVLGTIAVQNDNAVAITGGAVDGVAIGATTPSTGAFTTVTASDSVLCNGTGGIGYTTGAGGTVAQATDKSTAVTLNKLTGRITMNAAALAGGATVTFVLNNSTIEAPDMFIVTHQGNGTFGAYTINARVTGAGAASIAVRNNTAGSLSEDIIIKYAVFKSISV